MTGRVKTFDLGPAAIEACDTDHSSHRPDAVEWAESRLHLREALQTRSGRFMSAADLPGHGWVNEVEDLLMTMPWRAQGSGQAVIPGLAASLHRAWQAARQRGVQAVRIPIHLPGAPAWMVDMSERDGGLRVRLSCADADATRWMQARAAALSSDLQDRLQAPVQVEVVCMADDTARADAGPFREAP